MKKLNFKKSFLYILQSGIIPLSFLPTNGLFCKDATHTIHNKLEIKNTYYNTYIR